MDIVDILRDLVSFNTIEDKENQKIITYICDFLLKYGFKIEYKGKYLIMSIGENHKLGFMGHTDVVNYIEGWNNNPFELNINDDNIYGLGSCDMKGGIASILYTVSITDFSQLKYGVKLYFTYDEEIGFSGVKDIVERKEVFPEVMIFGEPTNNELLIGSKGLLEYKIKFKGIKVHSSNPDKGISANLNAIKAVNELYDFYLEKIKKFTDYRYDIPYTTMNIGIINGGSSINSVSSECEVMMDFRIIKKEHLSDIKNKVDELALKYGAEVYIINALNPFINEIDWDSNNKGALFITEASFIETNCKKKIIIGPGPVTAHEINEHVSLDSLRKTVQQYYNIIQKVCN